MDSDELRVFLSDRFWSKIGSIDDCWLWVGSRNTQGYGQMWYKGGRVVVHRLAYRALVGEIPEGLVIDHLCRVRNCVNPDHLEVVTSRENTLRGNAPSAQCAKRKACLQGHPYSLYVGTKESYRYCKVCQRQRAILRWQRDKKLRGAQLTNQSKAKETK